MRPPAPSQPHAVACTQPDTFTRLDAHSPGHLSTLTDNILVASAPAADAPGLLDSQLGQRVYVFMYHMAACLLDVRASYHGYSTFGCKFERMPVGPAAHGFCSLNTTRHQVKFQVHSLLPQNRHLCVTIDRAWWHRLETRSGHNMHLYAVEGIVMAAPCMKQRHYVH